MRSCASGGRDRPNGEASSLLMPSGRNNVITFGIDRRDARWCDSFKAQRGTGAASAASIVARDLTTSPVMLDLKRQRVALAAAPMRSRFDEAILIRNGAHAAY